MYNELIDAFLNIPQTRKSSSQTLATKYNVPLIDVQYMRTLDAEALNIFKSEFNHATISLETKKQAIKIQESNDFLGDLLEQRGIDRDQVTPTSMWIKDPKSKVNTFYSINTKVKTTEEPLDIDAIKDILTQQVTPKALPPKKYDEETLLLYISDSHIGMDVAKDSQYLSGWSKEMFQERLLSSLELVKKDQHVVVCLMGDMIDSVKKQTSRGGHDLPSNLSDKEMFRAFISSFQLYFESLSEITPNFEIYCVGEDNHVGHYQNILCESLKLWVNARFPNNPMEVFDKFIGHFNILSKGVPHTFMISHGKDSSNMRTGLPKNLNPLVETRITNYMIHNDIEMKTKRVHFIKADLHTFASEYSSNYSFRYKNTLSCAMPSQWVQTNFASTTSGISYDRVSGNEVLEGNLFF